MNNGWAIVLGAVIALLGGIISPWVTGWISRNAEERRERRARRSEVIQEITDAWMEMSDFDRQTEATSEQMDAAAKRARRAMTQFAVAADKRDEDAVLFIQWVTATAILEAKPGSSVRIAHWAAQQLYEWHWGKRRASALERDAVVAADYRVGA